MRALMVFLSAFTAFAITAGGCLTTAILALRGMPTYDVWLMSGVVGLVSAAKDMRSLLQLPPLDAPASVTLTKTETISKTGGEK